MGKNVKEYMDRYKDSVNKEYNDTLEEASKVSMLESYLDLKNRYEMVLYNTMAMVEIDTVFSERHKKNTVNIGEGKEETLDIKRKIKIIDEKISQLSAELEIDTMSECEQDQNLQTLAEMVNNA